MNATKWRAAGFTVCFRPHNNDFRVFLFNTKSENVFSLPVGRGEWMDVDDLVHWDKPELSPNNLQNLRETGEVCYCNAPAMNGGTCDGCSSGQRNVQTRWK